jgi:sugar/nucleoside kinase (ribokinase family)
MFGCLEKLMRIKQLWKSPNATVVGTGLVSLDVVLNERREVEPKLWTGGTCGNVLTILAYMGWKSYPVARLEGDAASRLIHRDLRRWNVHTEFLGLEPEAPTPVIVHRLRRTASGENFHSFSLNCPDCGAHLPSFRAIPISAAQSVVVPSANVFFTDRVSPGIIALAERCSTLGALVMFEPSSIGDDVLFERMVGVAHVIKYSNDRLADIPIKPRANTLLEVQTFGKAGLRYRAKSGNRLSKNWTHCDAYEIAMPVDTAGAGDWCTAGIIHALGRTGLRGLKDASADKLREAMTFGQALASWNCRFEGARGGMYEQTRAQFVEAVTKILRADAVTGTDSDIVPSASSRSKAGVCADCRCRTDRHGVLRRLHAAS